MHGAVATKPYITGDSLICPAGDSAIIFVTSAYSSYLWSDNSTRDSLRVFAGGSYRVTATNAQGCAAADTIVVTTSPAMTLTTLDTMVFCNGQNNGSIKLTTTGGTPALSFKWENNSILQNRANLAQGIYSVTVTDGAGCKKSKSDTIIQPTILSATAVATDDSCFGAGKGKITATPAGGTVPYSYTWSGGGATATKSNIGAGIYTVTITDKNLCTATAFDTVFQPTQLALTKVDTAVKCYGSNTGKIDVTVTGGTVGYTYLWNNAATTQDLVNIAAGAYSLTVKDAYLCAAIMVDTIATPDSLLLSFAITNVSCGGASNGAINLTVTGGTIGYTYHWENNSAVQNRTNLIAGNYAVTVTDTNSCTASKATTVIGAGNMTVTSADTVVRCFGEANGKTVLTVTGGTAPFHFLWNDSDTNAIRTNLVVGTYVVTVTDAGGCNAIDTAFINQPLLLQVSTIDTAPLCYAGATGSIAVTVTGGTTTYSFDWGAGVITSNRMGLAAGIYQITVTDAHSCTATHIDTIVAPVAITYNHLDTMPKCYGTANGSITVTGSGGTGALNYHWSNLVNSNYNPALTAGKYTLTIKDANNCSVTFIDTLSQPDTIHLGFVVTNISCSGGNAGAITLTVSGGTQGYAYSWTGGATTQNINSLAVGTYQVTVTDTNLCTKIDSATVSIASPLIVSSMDSDVKCFGQANGKTILSVSGGGLPYHYIWNDADTNAIRTNLIVGTYIVTVTDAGGCNTVDTAFINQPPLLQVSTINTSPFCFGGATGSIAVTLVGGTINYSYDWGGGVITQNRTSLVAGIYQLTVTDAHGCTINYADTLTQPSPINIIDTVVNVTCAGGNDGKVNIGVSGGVGGYGYQWSNTATTQNINGLVANTYIVVVTDLNSCTATDSTVVSQPSTITIISVDSNVSCFGANDGSITIHPSGGNGGYTFGWSNPQIDSIVTGLAANTYYVTITDSKLCTATDSFVITSPTALQLQFTDTNPKCAASTDGSIHIAVSGGSAGYTYHWSNTQTSQNISSLVAGWYLVTVTDAHNCIKIDSTQLTPPPLLSASAVDTDATCYGQSNGKGAITASGGTGAYTYTWSSIGSGAYSNILPAGNYTVTVNDATLCTATATVVIGQPDTFHIGAVVDSVHCFGGSDGNVNQTVSGANGGYTYLWASTQTTEDISNIPAGPYTVTITDSKNCTAVRNYSIGQPTALQVVLTPDSVKCYGTATGNVASQVTGGTTTYSYHWSNTATTAQLSNIVVNTYSLTVTDAHNCTVADTTTVAQPDSMTLTAIATDVKCNGAATGAVALTVAKALLLHS